jgi:hypothetical protein
MYLRRIREWPEADKVNPARWLQAFAPAHSEHATALLDSFVFVSDKQVRKLFVSTVHSLSSEIALFESSYAEKQSLWRSFLASVVVSAPTGEVPNPTDSGFIFQRLARTELGIDESRIVLASDTRNAVESAGGPPLLIVDDFAGSGEQFLATWRRHAWQTSPHTLEELCAVHSVDVYYLPLIATQYAIDRIAREAPSVKTRPSHILTSVYNALDADTIVFPDDLKTDAAAFVSDASAAAGITKWVNGFHDLGLNIAFGHSIPDACLALLWSEEGGWQPLMSRT